IRLRPVAASSSSQIALERRTSGTNSRPSPMACRVMRVSPCDEPWSCGGENRSIPTAFAPSLADWYSAELPTAPSPTTSTSAIVRMEAMMPHRTYGIATQQFRHRSSPSALLNSRGQAQIVPATSGEQRTANGEKRTAPAPYERLFPATHMTIRTLNSRLVYRNPWMTVREDDIERDNGTRGIYGVVEKCDSAIILAIEGDSIYLVEQYRYPIGANSLEFPQGSLERNDVDPAEIAREKLHAEGGLLAGKLDCLGAIHIACGYANQKTYAFLATGLTQSAGQRDAEEHDLVVRKVSLAELQQLIRRNVIKDAQTMAAWALYQARAAELRSQP